MIEREELERELTPEGRSFIEALELASEKSGLATDSKIAALETWTHLLHQGKIRDDLRKTDPNNDDL